MSTEKNLLIIDDDRNLRQTLAVIFRRAGYQVITAVDLSQARWYMKDHTCDLIVLDANMPDLMEEEFAGRERKNFFNSIPLILLLGSSHTGSYESVIHNRDHAILKKPVEPSEILGCAKGLLK